MDTKSLGAKLTGALPGVSVSFHEFQGQLTVEVDPPARAKDVLRFLRDDLDLQFDMLLDVTAVDYPSRPKRFEIVYILVSTQFSDRIRVKTRIADAESLPTVSDLWLSADWGERECFDMFGVRFEGHPNLKRILNPDNFYGYPLRKTYPLRGERDPAFLEYKETEPA